MKARGRPGESQVNIIVDLSLCMLFEEYYVRLAGKFVNQHNESAGRWQHFHAKYPEYPKSPNHQAGILRESTSIF